MRSLLRIRWQTSIAVCATLAVVALTFLKAAHAEQAGGRVSYRVLATLRTSSMEKELNEAADAGFRFDAVMGGQTAFGGKEVVTVMSRTGARGARYAYKLLATLKTSTMQKELQEAADAGYGYKGQTVFDTAFGGQEVVIILERDKEAPERADYKLIATLKTSTLENELAQAGDAGYSVAGMTVSKTALGGKELVAITRRAR